MARHANSNGVLDFEGTLQLFSWVMAPLPGVTVPNGADADKASWANLAMRQIVRHLRELTPEQLSVVRPLFKDAGGSPRAATSPSHPDVMLARYVAGDTGPTSSVRDDIVQVLGKAIDDVSAALGHGLDDTPLKLSALPVHLLLPGVKGSDGAGWVTAVSGSLFDADGNLIETPDTTDKLDTCYVTLDQTVWGKTQGTHWTPTAADKALVYEQVFRCFQAFVVGSGGGDAWYQAPAWVLDGDAEWAKGSLLSLNLTGWSDYLTAPMTPLSDRGSSAFGLFFEIEYLGRPLWKAWWGIWTAAAEGGWGTDEWFQAVVGNILTSVKDSWSSSFFLDQSFGYDWTTAGKGQKPAPPSPTFLYSGGDMEHTLDAYSTWPVMLQPPGNTNHYVVAYADQPNIRVADSNHQQKSGVNVVVLCWAQNCGKTCPEFNGVTPPGVMQVSGIVRMAYAQLGTPGVWGLTEVNAPDYCKAKHAPPAPQCPAHCAGSNGDPHMTSVNGRAYDFQAAGEFELLRSADGKLEIQARQEPLHGQPVTINTAVVLRLGDHRVGLYVPAGDGAPLEVHVDGKPVPVKDALTVGDARVLPHADSVEIDAADGTVVWALLKAARWGIILQVQPSNALRAGGTGVIGKVPSGYVLPLLPDGTGRRISVDKSGDYGFTYGPFETAWRVTDASSLFDYPAGKSTASYTVEGFVPLGGPPSGPVMVGAPPAPPVARAAAETACAGIDSVDLRAQCVYDVAVSGDTGFPGSYATADRFLAKAVRAESAAAGRAPAASTGAGTSRGPSIVPLVNDAGSLRGAVVDQNGSLDVVVNTPAGWQLISVDPATTVIRKQVTLSGPPGSPAVAGGSLWVIVGTTPGRCAVQRLDPSSLNVLAQVVPPSCPLGASPNLAGAGDQLWTVGDDRKLERIDVTTGAVSTPMTVPSTVNAGLHASTNAVFWSDQTGVFRIDAAAGQLVKVSNRSSSVFVDDGMWSQVNAGYVGFTNSAEAQPRVLAAGRDLVGADARNVYIEDPTTKEVQQLPVNGSAGSVLGTSRILAGSGSFMVIGGGHAYWVYTARAPQGTGQSLYVENYPLR